jgi:hypothetical protein
MRAHVASLAGVLIVGLLLRAATPVEAEDAATVAKNLAENILGKGTVRTSRVSNNGRLLTMVWESPTHRPGRPAAETRELLKAEVHLTWGAIASALTSVQNMEFEITAQKRSLCSGSVGRSRPFVITYTRDLR